MPKPVTRPPAASGATVGAGKGELAKKLPLLMGWVCDAQYDDGKPVGATSLTLRRDGQSVRATLKIADQEGLKLEVLDTTPERAMAALEAMLGAPETPWAADPFPLGSPARKKGRK